MRPLIQTKKNHTREWQSQIFFCLPKSARRAVQLITFSLRSKWLVIKMGLSENEERDMVWMVINLILKQLELPLIRVSGRINNLRNEQNYYGDRRG